MVANYFITPKAIANSSNGRIHNIYPLALTRFTTSSLFINSSRKLCRRYGPLTINHCIEMRNVNSAVHFLSIWSNWAWISDLLNVFTTYISKKCFVRHFYIEKSINCSKHEFMRNAIKVFFNLQSEHPKWENKSKTK